MFENQKPLDQSVDKKNDRQLNKPRIDQEDLAEDGFDLDERPTKHGEFPLPEPLQEIEDEKRAQAEADKILRQIEEGAEEENAAVKECFSQKTPEDRYWEKVFPPSSDQETRVRRFEELRKIIAGGQRSDSAASQSPRKGPLSKSRKKTDWPDLKSRQYKDND